MWLVLVTTPSLMQARNSVSLYCIAMGECSLQPLQYIIDTQYLFLYTSDVSADYTPVQKSTKSASCALGNGGVVGDEEMFVFQTQSASTICRAIEHRAKEISKRGQQKSTCELQK